MSDPVPSALADYAIREELGSGSYGSVYKVVRRLDSKTYALKEVNLQGMTKEVRERQGRSTSSRQATHAHAACCQILQERDQCYREAHVLVKLESNYIIKYYDAWVERVSAVHAC